MAKPLKILQLTPRFPFPPDDGGKIGIANITKEFHAAGAEVHLFSYYSDKPQQSDIEDASQVAEVDLFRHSTENTAARIFSSFLQNKSIYISKHISKDAVRYIQELVKSKNFDLVHADHTCMAPLGLAAAEAAGIPIGLRLHNIEWLIWKRYADTLPVWHPKRLYTAQQAALLRNMEARLIQKTDVSFAITDSDLQRARKLAPQANITVASAGVNIDEWKPDEGISRNQNELILATTYNWIHNAEAVRWFVKEVMPLLKKEFQDIKLTLIGKNAPDWLNEYMHLGVNPVGYVDRVQPWLNRATVYIAPLFVGGGIRIKILEAMSMKLPVVASPIAAEGITASEEHGLFRAGEASDFAEKISYLLRHKDRTALGKTARLFIEENYTWKLHVGRMLDEYKKLLAKA